jgi:hypothetical protein
MYDLNYRDWRKLKNSKTRLLILVPLSAGLVSVITFYLTGTDIFLWLSWFLIIASIYVGISHENGIIAKEKGRSYSDFVALSIVFTPFVMAIVTATMSPLPGSTRYIPPVVINQKSPSVTEVDQIEKLGKLRAKGLITEAEFNEKKAALLDRL